MTTYTQQECRDRFMEAAEAFAAKLHYIDADTPAVPYTEPAWWLAMSDLERRVLATIRAFKPVQP